MLSIVSIVLVLLLLLLVIVSLFLSPIGTDFSVGGAVLGEQDREGLLEAPVPPPLPVPGENKL